MWKFFSMSVSCWGKRLMKWEDPNTSAAVLTIGNILMLLLLNDDPIAWLQFMIVFGVLPIGLVARVSGMDTRIREQLKFGNIAKYVSNHTAVGGRESPVPGDSPADKGNFLIRFAVYMVIISEMVCVFGLILTIGVIGNACMLIPLIWKTLMADYVKRIPLDHFQGRYIWKIFVEKLYSIDPLAVPMVAGLTVFIATIIAGRIAESVVIVALRVMGYILVVLFALVPIETIERVAGDMIGKISSNMIIIRDVTDQVTGWIEGIIFWDNYTVSLTALGFLYVTYLVSAFTGLTFVVGAVSGVATVHILLPGPVKEKVQGNVAHVLSQVKGLLPKRQAVGLSTQKGEESGANESRGQRAETNENMMEDTKPPVSTGDME
jgi:hypothetical protein